MVTRILVVDDFSLNNELIKNILTPKGYEVTCAENGQEALDKVFNDPPDLILLDVMMPGMDGYEVCRRIRQNPSLPYCSSRPSDLKLINNYSILSFNNIVDLSEY